jgi:two-component system phosphate regulon response regulator OmpR
VHGVDVTVTYDLPDAAALLPDLRPRVTILDCEVREGYGLEMIPEIVKTGSWCLIVSTRNDVQDRVRALRVGAHDYVGKPIDIEEVYLRVKNILAHTGSDDDSKHILDLQGVKFDLTRRVLLKRDGMRGPGLTDTELSMLRVLADSMNRIVNREALYACLYEGPYDPSSRAVDVGVSRLRIKLKSIDTGVDIRSVRSAGYIFMRDGEASGMKNAKGNPA